MAAISSVPGMNVDAATLVRRGLITTAVVVVIAILAWGVSAMIKPDPMRVTLLTPSVAPGVSVGTYVEMNGVQIGKVSGIDLQGSGRLGVAMDLDKDGARGLTDGLVADFAPNNLFGITSVQITPSSAGRPLYDGATVAPAMTPADSTMSGLLRSLADVEATALRPYMSQVLRQADTATKGFLPLVRALGSVAQANAETQSAPTAQTLPALASALQGVGMASGDVLYGLRLLWDWNGPDIPGYPVAQTGTLSSIINVTAPDLTKLVKELQPLAPLLGTVVDLERRVIRSMPDAAQNGRQLSDLIEAIRRAIRDTPNGKVLDLDVQARPVPITPPQEQGGRR